ncbi:MAG: SPOR domain-containing protein [Nitrospinota bacterium]
MEEEREGYLYHFTCTGLQFGLVLLGLGTIFALSFTLGYVLGQGAGEERGRVAQQGERSLSGPAPAGRGERTVELPPAPPRSGRGTPEASRGQEAGEELTFFRILPDRPAVSPSTPPARAGGPEPAPRPSAAAPSPPSTARPSEARVEPRRATPLQPPRGFVVQVGSLKDAAKADALKERLRKRGYPAYVVRVELRGKGVWHRVRVGPFRERERAVATLGQLKLRERLAGAMLYPQ